MRGLFITLGLVAAVEAVLVLGALLGYPLFLVLGELGASLPFYKCTHYSGLALAFLAGLAWLMSRPGAAEGLLAGPWRQAGIHLVSGVFLGLLLLLSLEGLLMLAGARELVTAEDFAWSDLAVQAGKGLATGSAVGFLEEIIFRGVLLGILLRLLGVIPAAVLSSAIFSILHFLRPEPLWESSELLWYSGLELLWKAHVQTWLNFPMHSMTAALLFVLGLILALFRVRSGVLWPCIGLHLGLVLGLRVVHYCGYSVLGALPLWLYDPAMHPMGGVALGLILFFYIVLLLAPGRLERVVEKDARDAEWEQRDSPYIRR